jgi:flagellar biosynthetic protein FlhB
MSDAPDRESQTEEASSKKLEDARGRGEVAKTMELPSTLALAAVCAVVAGSGGLFAHNLAVALTPFLARPHEMIGLLESGHGAVIGQQAAMAAAPVVVAVMAAAMIAGVGGNMVQQGFLWVPSKLAPDFSRISPMAAFGRLFGVDNLIQFLRTLAKLLITGFVAWRVIAPHVAEIPNMAAMAPIAVLGVAKSLLIALFASVIVFLGLTAGLDWFMQRQRFMQRMRMSRQEQKEEQRQSDGDPKVKARIRQLRNQRARKRMMAQVPKATLVVTNPTHYAVALRYVAGETAAPLCVAKGADHVAMKIREVAGQHAIPIIEDPPLARALYASVEVDGVIPREQFEAVAKVIGFIMGRKNRPRARAL